MISIRNEKEKKRTEKRRKEKKRKEKKRKLKRKQKLIRNKNKIIVTPKQTFCGNDESVNQGNEKRSNLTELDLRKG